MKVSYREKFVTLHEHIIVTKILSIDWEIKGERYTIKKNLVSLLSRGVGVTTFGIYLRPQKIEVNFGGGATFGGRYYRNFTVTFWISIFRELRTLGPRKHSTFVL